MHQSALDGNFEENIGAKDAFHDIVAFDLRLELIVPMLTELGSPQTLRSAAACFTRAKREVGKVTNAQAGGLVIEGELHSGATTEHAEYTEGKQEDGSADRWPRLICRSLFTGDSERAPTDQIPIRL